MSSPTIPSLISKHLSNQRNQGNTKSSIPPKDSNYSSSLTSSTISDLRNDEELRTKLRDLVDSNNGEFEVCVQEVKEMIELAKRNTLNNDIFNEEEEDFNDPSPPSSKTNTKSSSKYTSLFDQLDAMTSINPSDPTQNEYIPPSKIIEDYKVGRLTLLSAVKLFEGIDPQDLNSNGCWGEMVEVLEDGLAFCSTTTTTTTTTTSTSSSSSSSSSTNKLSKSANQLNTRKSYKDIIVRYFLSNCLTPTQNCELLQLLINSCIRYFKNEVVLQIPINKNEGFIIPSSSNLNFNIEVLNCVISMISSKGFTSTINQINDEFFGSMLLSLFYLLRLESNKK